MYSVKMKEAVSSAQSCVDLCCGTQNVAVSSAEYISAFVKYLDVLDPSGIDFLKNGFFADMRIKKYWKLFSEHYSKVEAIIEKLKKNRIIAENTLMTIRNVQDRYQQVLDEFLSEEPEAPDMEYFNQKTVSLNLKNILDNTSAEYGLLVKRLEDITGMANDVFTNAVLIARVNYQINIVNEQSSGLIGRADVLSYKSDFQRLYGMCR
ncbi:MAG: hypothetical protein MJ095_09230 [Oscillospiraceae bacterium]|nr:hypothetical protein [Oscillospiraceae bacterium]